MDTSTHSIMASCVHFIYVLLPGLTTQDFICQRNHKLQGLSCKNTVGTIPNA